MDTDLVTLFHAYSELAEPPIIELLDINNKPVGALYLNKFRDKSQMIVSETNNQERFMFYCDGVAIFFSFWRKFSS